MEIRSYTKNDYPAIFSIWNECRIRNEILFRPLTQWYFEEKFLSAKVYEEPFLLVAEDKGTIIGFIAGSRPHEFLNGQSETNTPGYLDALMVRKFSRGKGVGSMLLNALEEAMRRAGKSFLDVSSLSPVNKDWIIPGTPGHEHNNMPGIDDQSPAFAFLQKRGYEVRAREVAMYLDLSTYHTSPEVEQKRERLKSMDIVAGRYDVNENCEWDEMCNRVGSEYWRKVLKDETASPEPRPIFAARTKGHIVGFTGPADVQPNGRGWFTGICTDPWYEKMGIATVLFNDLMCEFIHLGAQYSSLFTGTDNHAQRLYLKTGFRPARQFAMLRKELRRGV